MVNKWNWSALMVPHLKGQTVVNRYFCQKVEWRKKYSGMMICYCMWTLKLSAYLKRNSSEMNDCERRMEDSGESVKQRMKKGHKLLWSWTDKCAKCGDEGSTCPEFPVAYTESNNTHAYGITRRLRLTSRKLHDVMIPYKWRKNYLKWRQTERLQGKGIPHCLYFLTLNFIYNNGERFVKLTRKWQWMTFCYCEGT